jgi:hypothetical protein
VSHRISAVIANMPKNREKVSKTGHASKLADVKRSRLKLDTF